MLMIDDTAGEASGSSENPVIPTTNSVPSHTCHPLPPRPANASHEDLADNNETGSRAEPSGRKRRQKSADRSGKVSEDEYRDESLASREMLDSWIAPDIFVRSGSKRPKVSDITEWDTWIAPDLREEEERAERHAVSRLRARDREKVRKKRSRRTRHHSQIVDTWVADPHDTHGADPEADPDRMRKGLRHTKSPRRMSTESPPSPHGKPQVEEKQYDFNVDSAFTADISGRRPSKDTPPHMPASSPERH